MASVNLSAELLNKFESMLPMIPEAEKNTQIKVQQKINSDPAVVAAREAAAASGSSVSGSTKLIAIVAALAMLLVIFRR